MKGSLGPLCRQVTEGGETGSWWSAWEVFSSSPEVVMVFWSREEAIESDQALDLFCG